MKLVKTQDALKPCLVSESFVVDAEGILTVVVAAYSEGSLCISHLIAFAHPPYTQAWRSTSWSWERVHPKPPTTRRPSRRRPALYRTVQRNQSSIRLPAGAILGMLCWVTIPVMAVEISTWCNGSSPKGSGSHRTDGLHPDRLRQHPVLRNLSAGGVPLAFRTTTSAASGRGIRSSGIAAAAAAFARTASAAAPPAATGATSASTPSTGPTRAGPPPCLFTRVTRRTPRPTNARPVRVCERNRARGNPGRSSPIRGRSADDEKSRRSQPGANTAKAPRSRELGEKRTT